MQLKGHLSEPLLESGSWFGGLFNVLVPIVTFYVAVWPIGEEPNANNLFLTYLAAPIVLACVSFLFRSSRCFIRLPTSSFSPSHYRTDFSSHI